MPPAGCGTCACAPAIWHGCEEHVDGPGPERVALTRALAALPPNQRVAVVLYHLGGLSTVEIAEQQGVPEGTVRS